MTNADCESGECAVFTKLGQRYWVCSGPCTLDSDCRSSEFSLQCGIGEGGEKHCIPACGQEGVACENGIPVLCSLAKPESCAECGCPEGLVCLDGVGCKPPAAVGEVCRNNRDCETGNCSVFAHVCRVAVGEPCTDSNCDLCVTTNSGSYCSRDCESKSQCGDTFLCTSYAQDDPSYCRPPCAGAADPSCAGECTALTADTNQYACECPTCQTSTALREFGNGCDRSEQCASGDCLTGRTRWDDFGAGFCTKSCTASAECGEGWVCLDIPCVVSDLNCGRKCAKVCDPTKERDCEAGACQLWPAAGGGSVPACGPG